MRGMTQKQLAAECGQTDSAIRNYELGNRTPGDEQIRAIAAALAISPESLREVPLESSREVLELLFRIADEFGLEPMEVDGMFVLGSIPRPGRRLSSTRLCAPGSRSATESSPARSPPRSSSSGRSNSERSYRHACPRNTTCPIGSTMLKIQTSQKA